MQGGFHRRGAEALRKTRKRFLRRAGVVVLSDMSAEGAEVRRTTACSKIRVASGAADAERNKKHLLRSGVVVVLSDMSAEGAEGKENNGLLENLRSSGELRMVMTPVEHHSHSSGDDRVQIWLWRPGGLDDRGTGGPVESGVELDAQAGTLVQRERAEEAPFENGHIHTD